MKYNMEYVMNEYSKQQNLKYLFFWGHKPSTDGNITKSCLSQWYDCYFTINGTSYHTAEQYMMSQKAKLFNDDVMFQRIMNATHPNDYKKLGRKVKNFNLNVWKEHQVDIVINGNMAKFSQNEDIKSFLLNTKGRILVEASPYDTIWGIGLSCNAPNIENPCVWKGCNLLGFSLMQVRDNILALI